MKHTPGPWKHDGEIIYSGNYTLNNGWTNHATIAKVEDRANWEANARLIAAAPDLLDACKHLNAVCFDFAECNANGKTEFDTDVMIDAIETMRAAIAKAGGE